MDLSVKRQKTSAHQQRSHSASMTPASIANSMMPHLMRSEVIKKEVLDSGDNDRMSEKSDDSSDSGRLQMDISSQEDNEEFRNLPVLKPLGRDTPESNFSDDHSFESADQLWQALAQHSQCEFFSPSTQTEVCLRLFFSFSEWRQRSHSATAQNDQLPNFGNSILTTASLAGDTRSTDGIA